MYHNEIMLYFERYVQSVRPLNTYNAQKVPIRVPRNCRLVVLSPAIALIDT